MILHSRLDVLAAVAVRTWVKTLRRPVALTFSLVQPLFWMLLFGFLFERYPLASLEGAGTGYLSFLVPGVCGLTVLLGASQSGISLIRDLQTQFLPRMLATPADHRLLLAGKVAADVARLVLQALAVLALGLALGARLAPRPGPVLLGLLALALFAVAFASLSCLVALVARAQESMAAFVHVVNLPVLFTSTALVPSRQMPSWLQALSGLNPLTLAVDALRGALLFGRPPDLGAQLLPLAALAALLFLLAAAAMAGAARE